MLIIGIVNTSRAVMTLAQFASKQQLLTFLPCDVGYISKPGCMHLQTVCRFSIGLAIKLYLLYYTCVSFPKGAAFSPLAGNRGNWAHRLQKCQQLHYNMSYRYHCNIYIDTSDPQQPMYTPTRLDPLSWLTSTPESTQASHETSRSLRIWGSIFCTARAFKAILLLHKHQSNVIVNKQDKTYAYGGSCWPELASHVLKKRRHQTSQSLVLFQSVVGCHGDQLAIAYHCWSPCHGPRSSSSKNQTHLLTLESGSWVLECLPGSLAEWKVSWSPHALWHPFLKLSARQDQT